MSNQPQDRVLVVQGRPVPKARARVVIQGGRARAYTPQRTAAAAEKVRGLWLEQHGKELLSGPVGVRLLFCYGAEPYTSITVFPLSKEAWEDGQADIENCAKLVLDALQGVAYQDDRQVAWLEVEKVRTTQV